MKTKKSKGGSNVLNRTTHLYEQYLKRHSKNNTTPYNASKKRRPRKVKTETVVRFNTKNAKINNNWVEVPTSVNINNTNNWVQVPSSSNNNVNHRLEYTLNQKKKKLINTVLDKMPPSQDILRPPNYTLIRTRRNKNSINLGIEHGLLNLSNVISHIKSTIANEIIEDLKRDVNKRLKKKDFEAIKSMFEKSDRNNISGTFRNNKIRMHLPEKKDILKSRIQNINTLIRIVENSDSFVTSMIDMIYEVIQVYDETEKSNNRNQLYSLLETYFNNKFRNF